MDELNAKVFSIISEAMIKEQKKLKLSNRKFAKYLCMGASVVGRYLNRDRVNLKLETVRDRFVVLIPKAVNILQKIESQGEYIFMRDGKRITSRQVSYVLEKFADLQGVATKSSHKLRKTYASKLHASGIPLDEIRILLGHSNIQTILGYIYNPLTDKETYDLITKAL